MRPVKRLVAALLAATLIFGGAACGGDDEGEDRIGDGEINDEGD
jgi:hypothetical protein